MLEHTRGIFDRIAENSLVVLVGLLPLFFIPFLGLTTEINKTYLLAFGVTFGAILWIIARLVDGTLVLPKNYFVGSALALIGVAFLSALFSASPTVSFGGQAFEIGTFASILILVGFFLLGVLYIRGARQVTVMYLSLFGGFLFISLFQIAYLFIGSKYLSLGTFFSSVSNTVGKWNDFAIFVGFIALLGLITFELFQLQRIQKIILSIVLFLSLFFLALINFLSVWIVLGLFSLVVFIYTLSIRRIDQDTSAMKIFPFPSFVAVVVCLLFILGNTFVGGFLSSKFGIYHTEVRPSVQSTFSVTKSSIWKDPIFGQGPNRFMHAWSQYKPKDVNNTLFWDTNFSAGFGLIPSFSVTMGILGLIGWLGFIGLFVYTGVRFALRFGSEKVVNFSLLSMFVGALYLWIFAFIYNPGVVPFALAFVFSGGMVGLAISKGYISEFSLSFLRDARYSFFSILALVVLLVVLVGSLYFTGTKFAANIAYARSVQAPNTLEGLDKADVDLTRAIALDGSDTYYRSLAVLSIMKLNALLSQQNISKDTLKSQFQNFFGRAVAASQAALSIDKTNAENWITLGQVYQSVVQFEVPGAYDNAKSAYLEAQKLSPNNPGLELILARLDIEKKDTTSARTHIEQALKLKPNYTDAVFLLSQIEVSEGNIDKAISRVEDATLLDPNNSSLFFQLGLLRYNKKDWEGSVSAFEHSVVLAPSSLNAHYFLGLAYDKAGRHNASLEQFKAISTQVPDNTDIQKIIQNLEAGRPAIETVDKTSDTPKELPIKEKDK